MARLIPFCNTLCPGPTLDTPHLREQETVKAVLVSGRWRRPLCLAGDVLATLVLLCQGPLLPEERQGRCVIDFYYNSESWKKYNVGESGIYHLFLVSSWTSQWQSLLWNPHFQGSRVFSHWYVTNLAGMFITEAGLFFLKFHGMTGKFLFPHPIPLCLPSEYEKHTEYTQKRKFALKSSPALLWWPNHLLATYISSRHTLVITMALPVQRKIWVDREASSHGEQRPFP